MVLPFFQERDVWINTLVALAICAILNVSLFGEDLGPYDPLARNNINIKTSVGHAGAKTTGQPVDTDYGTYVKNLVTTKQILLTLSLLSADAEITVEAYAAFKDLQSNGIRLEKLKIEKLSPVEYSFVALTEKTRERWMYADDGRVSQTGEKILGWFVRIISNEKIIGFSGSSPQYE